jgi:uncharacterized membrane protein YkvA (DUF1232 family)
MPAGSRNWISNSLERWKRLRRKTIESLRIITIFCDAFKEIGMDDVKFGEILLPGDEDTRSRRERSVRKKFWPTFKRAVRQIPFSRDVVAAFYCAMDPATPTRVRGILLAALAYFVLPFDMIPDIFAVIGFSDDVAVLSAAFAMVSGHVKPKHYEAADKALSDQSEGMKTV